MKMLNLMKCYLSSFINLLVTISSTSILIKMMIGNLKDEVDRCDDNPIRQKSKVLTITIVWFFMIGLFDAMLLYGCIYRHFAYHKLLKYRARVENIPASDHEVVVYIIATNRKMKEKPKQIALSRYLKWVKHCSDIERFLLRGSQVWFGLFLVLYLIATLLMGYWCEIAKLHNTLFLTFVKATLSSIIFIDLDAKIVARSYNIEHYP